MKISWRSCLQVGISAFLLYLAITYWENVAGLMSVLLSASAPLIIGCVIAYVVNILMSFYEKRYFPKTQKPVLDKSRRPVCTILAFVSLIAVVALVIGLVIPELGACVQMIFSKLPDAMKSLTEKVISLNLMTGDMSEALQNVDWKSGMERVIGVLTSGVGNAVGTVFGAVGAVFSGIITAFLSIIFAIYLLTGKEKLGNQSKRLLRHYLKAGWYDKVMHIFSVLNDCFHKYIVGQCTEAVILGLLCTLGMFVLQLPYATMIGALVAFTALIPVAGAYIGAGVGAFMILTISPIKAIIFLIFIVVLQQLEGNLIYPRVVGSSMGLPAIWVLAAVTVGGGLLGIAGMLLSVPMAAAIYRLLQENLTEVIE